jgi:hypothetical protein
MKKPKVIAFCEKQARVNLAFIFILFSSIVFGQGGPKNSGIDSATLRDNILLNWSKGVSTERGSVVGGGGSGTQNLTYDPVYGSYFSIASGTLRTGSGRWNVVIGEGAGDNITSEANYNTLLGAHAGNAITTGDDNVFMGWDAGLFTTSGRGNVGFPQDALKYNLTGSDNIAIGKFSQYTNTRGQGNVGVGFNTLYYLEAGDENVVLGKYAGGILYKGSGNIFLGAYAGEANQSETNKVIVDDAIAIGRYTGLSKMFSRSITIGFNLQPTAANQINIGNVYKGDISTGNAEVNSISISGKKVTFDDNYMYVNTSTGVKRVPLQDVSAAQPQPTGFKVYNAQGQLLFYQPAYKQ